MTTLDIPRGERGQIRVFAVNRPIPDMSRALKTRSKEDLAAELLGFEVAPGTVELFAVSDLAGVGLPGYLAQGYDITEAQLATDRSRLDGLDGYVLLVFSSAFAGAQTTLRTGPGLTLIGTYGEARAEMSAAPIDSAAARPYSGTPSLTPATPPRSRAGSAVVGLGLLVAAVLVIIWIVR